MRSAREAIVASPIHGVTGLLAADRNARTIAAALDFVHGGGRTVLARQHVSYPFHITRPFYLDAARADLATLYLQSASGGIYSGDRLALALAAKAGTLAHVTTQAATIVHDTRGHDASQTTRLTVGCNGFLALTTDPFVLFPGAALRTDTEVTLERGACAVLAEGFSTHDPLGLGRPFARLDTSTRIRRADGGLLVADRGWIDGGAFLGAVSPLGRYRAVGSVLILGDADRLPEPATVEHRLDALACLAGACRLPNEAGLAVRILAPDGGTLAQGLDDAFALAFAALLGSEPARRRK